MDEASFDKLSVESLNTTLGSPGRARVILVFVLDGLCPDAMNPVDTPTLFRLRHQGVHYLKQGHSFSLGDFQHLVSLEAVSGGRLILVKTLGEQLQDHALQFAVVSSGSTGTSLLLNPHAIRGVGTLVNGYFDPGRT